MGGTTPAAAIIAGSWNGVRYLRTFAAPGTEAPRVNAPEIDGAYPV